MPMYPGWQDSRGAHVEIVSFPDDIVCKGIQTSRDHCGWPVMKHRSGRMWLTRFLILTTPETSLMVSRVLVHAYGAGFDTGLATVALGSFGTVPVARERGQGLTGQRQARARAIRIPY